MLNQKKHLLVLDIGSTSGRAFVFELPNYEIVGSGRFGVSAISPKHISAMCSYVYATNMLHIFPIKEGKEVNLNYFQTSLGRFSLGSKKPVFLFLLS